MSLRDQIVQAARSWVGTPFHHQGRLKGVGVDCGGLVYMVGKEVGLAVTDHPYKHYTRHPTIGKHMMEDCAANLRATEVTGPGSVLVFWVLRPDMPQHMGILSHQDQFIHAYNACRQVMEIPLSDYWRKRLYATFDFREVPPWQP